MESEKIEEIRQFKSNKGRLLGRLLNKSYRFMSEIAYDFLCQKGYPDFRVSHIVTLVNIDFEGTSVNTLAFRAGISKQAMSKIVKELTDAKYVFVEKDPSDARALVVQFTDRGYEALLAWKKCTEHIDQVFTNLLGSDKLEQVKDILGILVQHYEAYEHNFHPEIHNIETVIFSKK
jgi:DNA-binding MarR family transcriptional regulator